LVVLTRPGGNQSRRMSHNLVLKAAFAPLTCMRKRRPPHFAEANTPQHDSGAHGPQQQQRLRGAVSSKVEASRADPMVKRPIGQLSRNSRDSQSCEIEVTGFGLK